jgi:Leucine-rich repeat (LRR) protein
MRNKLTWGTLDYYISRLTSTENNPPLRIDICNQNLTDNDAIRLADALLHCSSSNGGGSRRGSTLKMLRLRGNNITSTGFLAICEAIGGVADSSSALEELDMGYNKVVSNIDDFAFAMYLLFSGAPNLKHLDLTGNRIGFANDGGMNLIREILSLNDHCGGRMETLNLSHNFLGDRAAILLAETMMMSDFKKSLKRLDLSLNYIGVRGAAALAEVVACNSPLEHLLLRCNSVGDSGAALFASALKTNSTLLELNLGYNEITSVGMNALRMAVYDTSSLDSIAASNHTVSIMFNGYCADYNDLRKGCTKEQLLEMDQVLRINALPKHYPDLPPVPQLKMAFRLRQSFDIKYFHQIDRKHMPEVLRFVSAHVGADKLFYLMKEVPLEVCAS